MKSRDILPLEDRTLKALSEYGMNRLLMRYSEALMVAENEVTELISNGLEYRSKARYEAAMKRYREGCTDVESLINQAAYGEL